jgi:hypothetical protein
LRIPHHIASHCIALHRIASHIPHHTYYTESAHPLLDLGGPLCACVVSLDSFIPGEHDSPISTDLMLPCQKRSPSAAGLCPFSHDRSHSSRSFELALHVCHVYTRNAHRYIPRSAFTIPRVSRQRYPQNVLYQTLCPPQFSSSQPTSLRSSACPCSLSSDGSNILRPAAGETPSN